MPPRDDDPRDEPTPSDPVDDAPDDADDLDFEDIDADPVGTPEFEPIQVRRRYLEGDGPSPFDPSRFVGREIPPGDVWDDDDDDDGRPGGFRPGARELRVLGVIAALAIVTLALFLPPVNILSRIGGSDRKSTRLNSSH